MQSIISPRQSIGNESMQFNWNENKASINLAKHGVSFKEAQTVFDDPLFVDFYDPNHSYDELRYLIIGESDKERWLIVLYTEQDEVTRIISAKENDFIILFYPEYLVMG